MYWKYFNLPSDREGRHREAFGFPILGMKLTDSYNQELEQTDIPGIPF